MPSTRIMSHSERSVSRQTANKGQHGPSIQPPKQERCVQKRVLLADRAHCVPEAEKAAKDYREVMSAALDGPVREAMRNRVESTKAQAEIADAKYEKHRRTHGC